MMEVMRCASSLPAAKAEVAQGTAQSDGTDSLHQPGHHQVGHIRSVFFGSTAKNGAALSPPKSSDDESLDDDEDDDESSSVSARGDEEEGSDEELIEDPYEEGGWSDEEDEETRKVRELKKNIHRSHSGEILVSDVLFKAPRLNLNAKQTEHTSNTSKTNIKSLTKTSSASAAPTTGMPSSPASKKSALPRHLQALQFRREKSNSTSSLYVNSTISAPNLDQVLWCMATAISYHTNAGRDKEQPVLFEIFDERTYPIVKGQVDVNFPRQKDIYKFLYSIFKAEKLPAECAILCLAYIERLIANTRITLHGTNWRRVTLGALILASKVWEDQAVWNVDFLSVFPNVNVNDLNKLEKYFLGLLTYNVSLKASEYCKYYFELRELAEKDSKSFPLKPLTTLDAQRLEQRAIETERRVKKLQRTSSADALPIKSPRAVIN